MRPGHPRLVLSRRSVMGLAAAMLATPALPALAAGRTLQGRVFYRERIALPPEAVLEVRLIDMSPVGARARTIAVTRVKTRHRMPIPYRLRFDPASIRSGRAYALDARISVRGKLWFTTRTRRAVLAGGVDKADIQVELVRSAGAPSLVPAGRWRVETIRHHSVADGFNGEIDIAADGRMTGSGGCNRISGKATVIGSHLSFGPLVSTKMACAPAIMALESQVLGALADTRLWRLDETRDKLILVDARGVTVLRLVKL